MRVELEPAYILHTRPYRETSMLVYALTEQHGLVHMVAKGVRKKNINNCQPFTKMFLSWSGKNDLVSLNKVEHERSSYTNNFRAQVQCFYMHELIIKLIPNMSPAPELFLLYEHSLEAMIHNPMDESVLRKFELQLLSIMGHPLQLEFDYINDEQIVANSMYRYDPDLGPTQVVSISGEFDNTGSWNIATGELLQQLGKKEFSQNNLSQAKKFLRGIMRHYLQGKPLMARNLLKVN